MRWLLLTFSTWEITVIVLAVFALLGLVAIWLADRFLPGLRTGEQNSEVAGIVLGVLAAVYGVVLAFVIVALYDDFRKTQSDIRSEATSLSMIYRDTRGLGATAAVIDRQIGDYIRITINDEWPRLAKGHDSDAAWVAAGKLYPTLQAYQPKTASQQAFYGEAVTRLNDFIGNRRERITDAEESLPTTFDVLLIGGALMIVAATALLGGGSRRMHITLVTAVAVLLGFNLVVGLVLDYPFAGQVSVSNGPFTQGALVHYAGVRGQ